MIKKILAVGAGPEQLASIKLARELGFKVIAADIDPNAVGFNHADLALWIDIKDEKKMVQIAKSHNIDLVLPAPIGQLLTVVGAINDALNLRGISAAAAKACTTKATCNKILSESGINVAQQKQVSCKRSLFAALDEIPLPVIIKPNRGSGSRGVRKITKYSDIPEIREGDWLLESFIEGAEYGVDAALFEGNFEQIMVREKEITAPPYRLATSYITPPTISSMTQQGIVDTVELAARALGFTNCLISADVIVSTDGRVYLIEIAGRPSGHFISAQMVPSACGRNSLSEIIQLLDTGGSLKPFKAERPTALTFIDCPSGTIRSCKDLSELTHNPNLLSGECHLKKGLVLNELAATTDAFSRGWIITTGDTPELAKANARDIIQKLEIEVIQ